MANANSSCSRQSIVEGTHRRNPILRVLICCFASGLALNCSAQSNEEIKQAALQATRFLTDKLSVQGGYLWTYSADLGLREGEGAVERNVAWVQPPATPSIGMAMVDLYLATGDNSFLDAALSAADALRRGQLRSGGWTAMVEFEPEARKRWAYRIDPPGKKRRNYSTKRGL